MATQATQVFLGTWVNWTHGQVLGATITLSNRSGGLLISFVAAYVTIVGAQLWKILSFMIHQIRSSEHPQDGLHYQQQSIFRNTASPGGAAWTFFQQLWYWPEKASKVFLRTVPWAIFSILYIVLFTALATFSSEVSKATGRLRLIDSHDNCGYWLLDPADPKSPQALAAFNQKMTNDSFVAASYARSCYGGAHSKLQCGTFPVPNIPWQSKANASCPFESDLCVYGNTAALQMTTGKIDSHVDLGIDMPVQDRVQVIKDTTCAPLIQNYQTVNGSSNLLGFGKDGDTIIQYYYGGIGSDTDAFNQNFTWQYNTHTYLDQVPYTTWSLSSVAPHDNNAGWNPHKALNQSDADLSIIFIAGNSMKFMDQVDDPVFGAHFEVRSTATAYYSVDEWAVPIACAERYKVCNPNTDGCTKWVGIMQMFKAVDDIGLNPIQRNQTDRLALALQVSTVYHQTFTRAGTALRAWEFASGLTQQHLPINQWEIEVSSWFDSGLSRLQHVIQDYATGPTNVNPGSILWQPAKEGDKVSEAMCHKQLIKDTGETTSFSIVGLVIIFVIGGFILFTSVVLEPFVGWLQDLSHKSGHKKMAWQLDDRLQQQRMLLEGVGLGSWEGARGFPTTVQKQKFGGYDSFHVEHPAMLGVSRQIGYQSWSGPPSGDLVPNQVGDKNTDVFVRELS